MHIYISSRSGEIDRKELNENSEHQIKLQKPRRYFYEKNLNSLLRLYGSSGGNSKHRRKISGSI